MVNEHVQRLRAGSDQIVQVRLELSDEQLLAVAPVTQGPSGTATPVPRSTPTPCPACARSSRSTTSRLTGRPTDTPALNVDQLGVFVRALRNWLARRDELGFLRPQEAIDAPLVEDMVEPLTAV